MLSLVAATVTHCSPLWSQPPCREGPSYPQEGSSTACGQACASGVGSADAQVLRERPLWGFVLPHQAAGRVGMSHASPPPVLPR